MGATTVEELEIIVSTKIEQVRPQIQRVVQEIKNAVKETEGIGSGALGKINTQKIASEASKAKQQIDKILSSDGVSAQERLLVQQINEIRATLDTINRPGSKVHFDTVEVLKMEAELEKLQEKLNKIQNKKIKLDSQGNELEQPIERANSKVRELVNNLRQASAERLKNAIKSIPSYLSRAGQGVKNLASKFSSVKSSASKFTGTLKTGLGQIFKMAGALFGLRTIYNVLRNAASEWLNSQNAQAKQLSANIEYMKYALGSALAPVIEIIVNLIYQALKGVQSLIYALTGVNIFANASAKSYASMAKNAKKTKDETLKLADIDEIHNIQEDTSNSGNSGNNASPNFDLSGVETADWIQKLVDNIKNGNWYEIGATIGNKVNESLEKVPWDKIKNTAGKIGKNLAEFLNGGIKTIDWTLVGKTLAEGINTIIEFGYNFVTTFDWKGTGQAIADTINGLFNNIDWEKLGKMIGERAKGVLTTIYTAIEGIDWRKVGESVKTFIVNIDWNGIADALFRGIGAALGGLASFFGGLLSEGIEGAKKYFQGKIEECGGNVVDGIFKGIVDGLKNIGQWIHEHIFEPMITGFKNAFGIHSPSTVMAEQGEYIIEGLKEGIIKSKKIIDKALLTVKAWFAKSAEGIANLFIDALNGVIRMINSISFDLPDWLGGGHFGFDLDEINHVDFSSKYIKQLEEMDKETKETTKSISKVTVKTFEEMENKSFNWGKSTINNYNSGIKNQESPLTNAINRVKLIVSGANQSGSSYSWGNSTMNNYNSGINSQQGTLVNVLNTFKSKIQTYLNQSGSSNSWGSSLISNLRNGANGQTNNLYKVLSGIQSETRNRLNSSNSSYTWGKDMVQGFINGINSIKSKLTNTVRNIASSISSFLHFSRPDEGPLRNYETWMPDMIKGLSNSLLQSAPTLDNAVSQVSNNIADNLRATDLSFDVNSNINKNINSNIMSSQLENAVYSAIQKAESLFRLTINNELKINSKTIAKEIIDDLNDEARRRGYQPILQRG